MAKFGFLSHSDMSIYFFRAPIMRELKKRGVKKLKVVYSEEIPLSPIKEMSKDCQTNAASVQEAENKAPGKRAVPGSVAFVPSVAGLIIAGEVVKDITGLKGSF